MTDTKKPAKPAAGRATPAEGWTDEEKAAMKEHARELKAAAKRAQAGEDGEADLLAKIAEMPEPDHGVAERIHAIITANFPGVEMRTWYGMPAYAKDGKVICFVQPAAKFKARYLTLGFNDGATLDDGAMWPTSYAVTKLTAADEAKIAALIRKAAG